MRKFVHVQPADTLNINKLYGDITLWLLKINLVYRIYPWYLTTYKDLKIKILKIAINLNQKSVLFGAKKLNVLYTYSKNKHKDLKDKTPEKLNFP